MSVLNLFRAMVLGKLTAFEPMPTFYVAVRLQGPWNFVAIKPAMDNAVHEVLLDSGVHIQPLPIWEGE
jgi:hypothetical protein